MNNEEKQPMDLLQRSGLSQLEADLTEDVARVRNLMVQTQTTEQLEAARMLLKVQHGILDTLALVKGKMALGTTQNTSKDVGISPIR